MNGWTKSQLASLITGGLLLGAVAAWVTIYFSIGVGK